MAISLQVGQLASEPLWQKLLVATAAPLTTAIFGSLLAAGLASALLDRKRRKDSERDLQEQFVQEMARIASTFYFEMLQFRRLMKARAGAAERTRSRIFSFRKPQGRPGMEPDRIGLAENYRTFRVAADTLEARVGVYFATDEVREKWHAVSDLLTVRYHDTVGTLTPLVLRANARSEDKLHSGLTAEELMDAGLVARTYKLALNRAIEAVTLGERHRGRRKHSNGRDSANSVRANDARLQLARLDDQP